MRVVTWLVLVGLAIVGVWLGRPGLALALAGTKAVLVGLEFMELRRAHRLCAVGFCLAMAGLTGLLALLLAR